MKTLELKLKKDVLIVDAISEKIAYGIIFQKLGAKTVSDYEFLCNGSELTEEIASELVENYEINFYVDYNSPNHYGYCFTPLESFISAVESKGFYWLENTNSKTYFNPEEYIESEFLEFKEAEEKTFRNPLIFVKK